MKATAFATCTRCAALIAEELLATKTVCLDCAESMEIADIALYLPEVACADDLRELVRAAMPKFFDVAYLRQGVATLLADWLPDYQEEDVALWYVGDIVSGSYGRYIPQAFCELARIPACQDADSDGYWADWDDVLRYASDWLGEQVEGCYIDYLESDGSLGIFLAKEVQ